MTKLCLLPLRQLLDRRIDAVAYADNDARGRIVGHGYSVALRHVRKRHRLSISFLNEVHVRDGLAKLCHIPSESQTVSRRLSRGQRWKQLADS